MRIKQIPAGARAEAPFACARLSRLWTTALLSSAIVLGGLTPAMALPQDFWSDEIIYEPEALPPPVYHRRAKPVRHRAPKVKETATPTRKPQRPLIVAVSIKNQSLKVYDANGLFAEAPVSTGMRGHATPLGIFSVIQKNKWHRSNIYSGAPMPYMQRLTWSGIAMHAGALPGYPASHGCIRMPNHFATQIWNWTRMGARVVVTSGEVSPVAFSHPLLITERPAPQVAPPVDTNVPSADASPAALINAAIDSAKSTNAATTALAIDLKDLRPSLMPTMSGATEPTTTGLAADKPTKVADASATLTPPNSPATLNDGVTAPAGEAAPAVAVAPPAPKRTGPIAVFISGKDGKLYVRQNFEPLFDVPITIASSERPLGTHVFTAQAVTAPNDGDSATTFRWTALTMPVEVRSKAASHRAAKRRHDIGAIDTEPAPTADSAAEALDRLTIPAETMTRLAEALTTGSSIIVSDQALDRSETGQGTDFIVPLR